MRLIIEIQCDNQAFVEDQEDELYLIFTKLAYRLPPHGEVGQVTIMDSNGNRVGEAVVVDE